MSSNESFVQAMLSGLTAQVKATSPKYLYDERGSALFERICQLDEYYLYRTELDVLEAHATEIAALLSRAELVIELGSGSATKTRLLLDRLASPLASPLTYVPIDVARQTLDSSSTELARAYPRLKLAPLCADFTDAARLERLLTDLPGRRSMFFPGSTIGNFDPPQARLQLENAARLLGPGQPLVLGIDLIKDRAILEAAYNDRKGLTAAFNLNLLARMNRECGAGFELEAFRHRAIFNPRRSRIEMHIVSLARQTVTIAGTAIAFNEGETIHTESSYKYSIGDFSELVQEAGFEIEDVWTDARGYFAVFGLVACRCGERRRTRLQKAS